MNILRTACTALVVVAAGSGFGLWLTSASAHTNIAHSADCAGVSGLFASFPDQENEVTVTMDGLETDRTFTGPAGQVDAKWSDVGVDVTDGAVHSYGFSWSADGGGTSGVFDFDASGCVPPPICTPEDPCVPPPCYDPMCPTPTTEAPPTTEGPQVSPTIVFDDGDPAPPPVSADPAVTG